jgi:hypothetical protein
MTAFSPQCLSLVPRLTRIAKFSWVSGITEISGLSRVVGIPRVAGLSRVSGQGADVRDCSVGVPVLPVPILASVLTSVPVLASVPVRAFLLATCLRPPRAGHRPRRPAS